MSSRSTLAKKDGWGAFGKLHTGDKVGVVSMQATFKKAYTYVVEFSKTNNPASNNPIFAEAIITFAVEGNFISRRVNISDGVTIAGVAQAIKIQMVDTTVAGVGGPPNGTEYLVSCQVTPGTRAFTELGPTLVPQSTIPPSTNGAGGTYVIGAGASVTLPVPQDAGAIAVEVIATDRTTHTLAAGNLTVQQTYGATAVKKYDAFLFAGVEVSSWVPITPGADSILLTNHTGHTIDASVTFEIDG